MNEDNGKGHEPFSEWEKPDKPRRVWSKFPRRSRARDLGAPERRWRQAWIKWAQER